MSSLAVVIPTHRRLATLRRNLELLGPQAAAGDTEVVIVDDGSDDGTAAAVAELARTYPAPLRFDRLDDSRGPGAARNRGLALASAPAVLFLGDDTLPAPGLVARHLAFHRDNTDAGAGLLGRIVPAPAARSPFTDWLHEHGKQFAFASIEPGRPVPAALFNTANASVKRELLARVGGFDERFGVGNDDVELGLRLEDAGLRLSYDPEAVAEHDHPTDLEATLRRMRSNGRSYRLLTETHPDQPRPRPPGARHRLKAAAFGAAALLPPARRALREPSWTFLCEEAHREGFWGEPDPAPPAAPVRIGSVAARLGGRDPSVRSVAAPAAAQPDGE